jgi:hypothetical protein
MGRMISRRRSAPFVLTGGPTNRPPEWTPSPGGGLDHILEVSEIQIPSASSGLSNAQLREMSLLEHQNVHGKRGEQEYDRRFMGHRVDLKDEGHRP